MRFGRKTQAYSSDDFESDEGGFEAFSAKNSAGCIENGNEEKFHNINFDEMSHRSSNEKNHFLNLKNFLPTKTVRPNESHKFRSYLIGASNSYAKCVTAENLYDLTIDENFNEVNSNNQKSLTSDNKAVNSQSYNDFNVSLTGKKTSNLNSDDSLDFKDENFKCQEEISFSFTKNVTKNYFKFLNYFRS